MAGVSIPVVPYIAPIESQITLADTVEAQEIPKVESLSTKEDYIAYARESAIESNVDADTVLAVINCESHWNPEAVGDHGNSFGLSQIHLPSHPNVSREEALDPKFAIDFMVSAFAEKKENMWTCFRLLK